MPLSLKLPATIGKKTRWLIIIICIVLGALLPFVYRWYKDTGKPTFKIGGINYYLEGLYYGDNGGFLNPIGIAVSEKGLIYVADSGRNQIAILNEKGKEIKRIGRAGNKLGELSYPVSLAINTGANQLIVSEMGNNRVQVFDLQGESLGLFPFQSRKPVLPTALTVDAKGNLYIVDKSTQEILVYSTEGKLLSVLGKDQEEGFMFPMGIAISSQGSIIVSDSGNAAVKLFDSYGSLLQRIPAKGPSDLFNNPRGVAVDSKGNLYVTDSLRGVVVCFDKNQKVQGVLSVPEAYTPLFMPDGIAWLNGNLYVVDKGNGRIVKYTSMNANFN